MRFLRGDPGFWWAALYGGAAGLGSSMALFMFGPRLPTTWAVIAAWWLVTSWIFFAIGARYWPLENAAGYPSGPLARQVHARRKQPA
ncbi:MAG: hypothetical protein EPO68_18420 [Planctomycetota bacterium]|nr:MAG: hypothetical protein EPO68_18420 [Planctomycetota bacterium]